MIFGNNVGGYAHLRVDDVVPRKHIVQPEHGLELLKQNNKWRENGDYFSLFHSQNMQRVG